MNFIINFGLETYDLTCAWHAADRDQSEILRSNIHHRLTLLVILQAFEIIFAKVVFFGISNLQSITYTVLWYHIGLNMCSGVFCGSKKHRISIS